MSPWQVNLQRPDSLCSSCSIHNSPVKSRAFFIVTFYNNQYDNDAFYTVFRQDEKYAGVFYQRNSESILATRNDFFCRWLTEPQIFSCRQDCSRCREGPCERRNSRAAILGDGRLYATARLHCTVAVSKDR